MKDIYADDCSYSGTHTPDYLKRTYDGKELGHSKRQLEHLLGIHSQYLIELYHPQFSV